MKISFVCNKCHKKQEVDVLEEVELSHNDKLLTSISNLSFYKHKCGNCGEENLIEHPLVIKNNDESYQIYINTNKTLALFCDESFTHNRVVANINEANEKIRIFHCYLDDRIIEIIKALIVSDIESNNDVKIKEIYFSRLLGDKVEHEFLLK